MQFLLVLIFSLFSFSARSNTTITSQIHDIDMGQLNERPLIFLTSGQVVTYSTSQKASWDELKNAIKRKSWFIFSLNHQREIISMQEILHPPIDTFEKSFSNSKILQETQAYHPSILKDMDQARSFFNEGRMTHKESSQCFNRAHVWAYEWRLKRNLYSSKVWLFFTRKFIRKYQFEWWFHVAPMVHVVIDGKVKERIMDIKYARGPANLRHWTNIFLRDSAQCPVVQKYSDQANFPESGSCFIMKSSMYYYQPVDLENLELTGESKNLWFESEVKNAYLEAFDEKL